MDIKEIPKDALTLISASAYINNFTRAIEELVYNSLDAECTSIAIRVSIQENFIQILDNGIGIKKENFNMLGQKYATSKNIDLSTLKSAPDKYGFRGLSLSCIIEISKNVLISSRFHESGETWLKTFHNGAKKEVCIAPLRPSKGTTIEIRGFLYNLNVQRKSINNVHELQNIKTSLERLSLIHCNVSLSLRDDYKNEIIFKIHKQRDIYQTLWSLFEIKKEDIQELQVEKKEYKVQAFISKGNVLKQYQWIYLNGKFVSKTELHKKINKAFNNLLLKHKKITKIKSKNNECANSDLPFYFIFISCPFYDFDITYNNKQTLVEFEDWTEMDKIIEKLIQFYCGDSFVKKKVPEINRKIENTRLQVKQIIDRILNNNVKESRISSIQYGIQGKNIKRKNKKRNKQSDRNVLLKSQKLKNHVQVLSFQTKQEVPNVLVNLKKMYKNKTEFRKSSLKDNNKRNTKKVSRKQKHRIKKVDSLISKFKNPTDSVKKRCQELSLEAQNINVTDFKNKVVKLTYTAEFNEKIYCCNKKVDSDTCRATTKTRPKNNVAVVNPKTSYDLIQTFKENNEFLTSPDDTEIKFTHRSPVLNSDSYKTLLTKNTFDSHNYKYYYEEKKNTVKRFIRTNSLQNFLVDNKKSIFLHENLQKTKKNLFKKKFTKKYFKLDPISDNENSSEQKIKVNRSYLNKNDDIDYHLDINDISDLRDNQSPYKSNFELEKCSVENRNEQNITYSVRLSNNITENAIIELSCGETEPFLNDQNVNVESNVRSTSIVQSPNTVWTMDPLNYCEVIFKSNGVSNKESTNNFNNNLENNISFNDKLRDGCEEITEDKLLNNVNTKDNQLRLSDMNSIELNVLNENNFAQDMNTFHLKKRLEFVPKGMSQIFKTRLRKNVVVSNSKTDYYENTVYKNFADHVLMNTEIFSPTLQNVDVRSRKFEKTNCRDNSNLIFNALSLKEAKVLGQIDRKFIATKIKNISDSSLDFLVLFDQHAVDERVQLETNLSDYFTGNIWNSVAIDSVSLKLDKRDLLYLNNHRLKFIQFGLQWEFLDDKILINSIPKAILGKNTRQVDVVLKAVKRLILEEIDVIKSLGGNVTLYPKAIMDLVFSEACRYAIKFGDKLSKSDCEAMLKMLSTCKTPFQCAHGRPVMAVLIDLPKSIRDYEVNVKNIKRFKVRTSM